MAKTILSEEQKNQVIHLFRSKPEMSLKEIVEILNFPMECVRSLKAHFTMGSYDKDDLEENKLDFEISLSMERDLQAFLLNDLNQVEQGLKLYENGKEFFIDVGRIDILAIDKNNDFVVIELKAGKAKDNAIGQLLGYMGYVSEKIAKNKKVRGYIIANDFEDRLKYAVKNLKDVRLKAYNVNFSFKDIT